MQGPKTRRHTPISSITITLVNTCLTINNSAKVQHLYILPHHQSIHLQPKHLQSVSLTLLPPQPSPPFILTKSTPTSTMCTITQHLHSTCRHPHHTTITQPCHIEHDSQTPTCSAGPEDLEIKTIVSRSVRARCANCYLARLSEIWRIFEAREESLMADIGGFLIFLFGALDGG